MCFTVTGKKVSTSHLNKLQIVMDEDQVIVIVCSYFDDSFFILLFLPSTQDEQDRPFEEELIRNPHNVKSWLRYISMKAKSPPKVVYMLYERAVKQLPGR